MILTCTPNIVNIYRTLDNTLKVFLHRPSIRPPQQFCLVLSLFLPSFALIQRTLNESDLARGGDNIEGIQKSRQSSPLTLTLHRHSFATGLCEISIEVAWSPTSKLRLPYRNRGLHLNFSLPVSLSRSVDDIPSSRQSSRGHAAAAISKSDVSAENVCISSPF